MWTQRGLLENWMFFLGMYSTEQLFAMNPMIHVTWVVGSWPEGACTIGEGAPTGPPRSPRLIHFSNRLVQAGWSEAWLEAVEVASAGGRRKLKPRGRFSGLIRKSAAWSSSLREILAVPEWEGCLIRWAWQCLHSKRNLPLYVHSSQCFGSALVSMQIWIQIQHFRSLWSGSRSRSRVLMTKTCKNVQLKKSVWSKIVIYLSQGLHKGTPSYPGVAFSPQKRTCGFIQGPRGKWFIKKPEVENLGQTAFKASICHTFRYLN